MVAAELARTRCFRYTNRVAARPATEVGPTFRPSCIAVAGSGTWPRVVEPGRRSIHSSPQAGEQEERF